jgi:hypothetical protein
LAGVGAVLAIAMAAVLGLVGGTTPSRAANPCIDPTPGGSSTQASAVELADLMQYYDVNTGWDRNDDVAEFAMDIDDDLTAGIGSAEDLDDVDIDDLIHVADLIPLVVEVRATEIEPLPELLASDVDLILADVAALPNSAQELRANGARTVAAEQNIQQVAPELYLEEQQLSAEAAGQTPAQASTSARTALQGYAKKWPALTSAQVEELRDYYYNIGGETADAARSIRGTVAYYNRKHPEPAMQVRRETVRSAVRGLGAYARGKRDRNGVLFKALTRPWPSS